MILDLGGGALKNAQIARRYLIENLEIDPELQTWSQMQHHPILGTVMEMRHKYTREKMIFIGPFGLLEHWKNIIFECRSRKDLKGANMNMLKIASDLITERQRIELHVHNENIILANIYAYSFTGSADKLIIPVAARFSASSEALRNMQYESGLNGTKYANRNRNLRHQQ